MTTEIMTNIKTIFFLTLTVLILSSCSTNDPQTNLNSPTSFFADTAQNDNSHSLHLTYANIFGDWTNCSTTFGGVTTTANVCRTIRFKSDGTAIITYPSQEREVISWKISNDQIDISWTGDKTDSTNRLFDESIYETHLTKDAQGFNLELKAKNKDLTYYLGRQFN